MSLNLQSNDQHLENTLRQYDADGKISPVEFQEIRDAADAHANFVIAQAKKLPELSAVQFALRAMQRTADLLAESLQDVALAARQNKLNDENRLALKAALEHQLAYVILGYKSGPERL